MIKTSRKFTRAKCKQGPDTNMKPDDWQDHADRTEQIQDECGRSVIINEWALDWPIKHSGTSYATGELKTKGLCDDYRTAPPFSSPAERMVGLGFRCWMRGVQTGDTRFFDVCSRHYILSFGLKNGIILTSKLADWVYELDRLRQRPISIHQMSDAGFSYDEVVAISMIAACQHSECPALKACVYAITQASPVGQEASSALNSPAHPSDNHIARDWDAGLEMPSLAAKDFADGLVDAGQILSHQSITYPLQAMTTEVMSFAN